MITISALGTRKITGTIESQRLSWAILRMQNPELMGKPEPVVDATPLALAGIPAATWLHGGRQVPVTLIEAEPGAPLCTVLPDGSTYMRDVPSDLVAFEVA
jgi:hypothetical protein